VGLLLFNTSMQQASFSATALENEATSLAARQQTLKMELEDLRTSQRVAQEAQKMGMVVPVAPTFLTLDGTIKGERVPALPENKLNLAPPAPIKPKILEPAPTVVKVTASPDAAAAAWSAEKSEQAAKNATRGKSKSTANGRARR